MIINPHIFAPAPFDFTSIGAIYFGSAGMWGVVGWYVGAAPSGGYKSFTRAGQPNNNVLISPTGAGLFTYFSTTYGTFTFLRGASGSNVMPFTYTQDPAWGTPASGSGSCIIDPGVFP